MSTILLVEDNPHIMKINAASLSMESYRVLRAETAAACLDALREHDIDLIVLDVMLPDGDGVSLCAHIKQQYEIPILFLSALGENEDVIAALRAGGDDYLAKPYDIGVLIARVEARLRSTHKEKRFFSVAGLRLDTTARLCYCESDIPLPLTQKEFSLLLQLARQGGQGIGKESLYESVWGSPLIGDSSALHTAISRLNAKLAKAHARVSITHSADKGYALEHASAYQ